MIDFGVAEYFTPGQRMTRMTGSSFYLAPQVLLESYTEKCDIWSIGVIAYALLLGNFPFDDKNEDIIWDKILGSKLAFSR